MREREARAAEKRESEAANAAYAGGSGRPPADLPAAAGAPGMSAPQEHVDGGPQGPPMGERRRSRRRGRGGRGGGGREGDPGGHGGEGRPARGHGRRDAEGGGRGGDEGGDQSGAERMVDSLVSY